MEYTVVLITASSPEEAEKIANTLIDLKLAACVNIIPHIKSVYTWKGKRENSDESLLIVKTKSSAFEKLKSEVKKIHSYENPEIISLLINNGSADYLNWINEVVPI